MKLASVVTRWIAWRNDRAGAREGSSRLLPSIPWPDFSGEAPTAAWYEGQI